MILRIEDTDQTRYVSGAVENIIRTLEWAGLSWDEGPVLDDGGNVTEKGKFGPYFQSQRLDVYREHAERLIQNGRAYRCFCPSERLKEMRERQQNAGLPACYDRHCRQHLDKEEEKRLLAEGRPYVIRLEVPLEGKTEFVDLVRGKVSFPNDNLDDQVLLKSDGYPTYHLANVVDDHLMEVTHVIRGEEWVPSTPKHILLYEAFGWEPPKFAHLPLLLNSDRSKLSKRQGDVAVEDYRAKGYLPDALTNYVALLGYNPTADREIYEKRELIDLFDIEKVNKGGAVFSTDKLNWMNGVYLRGLNPDRLAELARPYFISAGFFREEGERLVGLDGLDLTETFRRVVQIEAVRAERLDGLAHGVQYFFTDDYELDAEQIPWKKSSREEAKERLRALRELLAELPENAFAEPVKLEEEIKKLIEDRGWSNGDTLWPMRFALTGQKASPSPFEVAWVLGKKRTVSRLDRAIGLLDS
jgi:glutamyl-tRNA synthetase